MQHGTLVHFILRQAPTICIPLSERGEWCSVLTSLGWTPLWGAPLHCWPFCFLLLGICLLRSMSSLLSERQTKQERERGRELKEQEIKRKSERARERKRDNRSCKPSHSNQANTLPCANTNPIKAPGASNANASPVKNQSAHAWNRQVDSEVDLVLAYSEVRKMDWGGFQKHCIRYSILLYSIVNKNKHNM